MATSLYPFFLFSGLSSLGRVSKGGQVPRARRPEPCSHLQTRPIREFSTRNNVFLESKGPSTRWPRVTPAPPRPPPASFLQASPSKAENPTLRRGFLTHLAMRSLLVETRESRTPGPAKFGSELSYRLSRRFGSHLAATKAVLYTASQPMILGGQYRRQSAAPQHYNTLPEAHRGEATGECSLLKQRERVRDCWRLLS